MEKWIDKLKERWKVESLWQVLIVLFIFSITGFSTLYVKHWVFDLAGITDQTDAWIKVSAWLLTVFPSYQILFLFYGLILGQFQFVWEFEKRSWEKLKQLFSGR